MKLSEKLLLFLMFTAYAHMHAMDPSTLQVVGTAVVMRGAADAPSRPTTAAPGARRADKVLSNADLAAVLKKLEADKRRALSLVDAPEITHWPSDELMARRSRSGSHGSLSTSLTGAEKESVARPVNPEVVTRLRAAVSVLAVMPSSARAASVSGAGAADDAHSSDGEYSDSSSSLNDGPEERAQRLKRQQAKSLLAAAMPIHSASSSDIEQ